MATNVYTIPLKHLFKTNKERRAKKAVREIRRFLAKHKRLEEEKVVIAVEVNKEIWKKGMYGIPRKIEVELMEEEGKTIVFLKGGKEAKERVKKKKEEETKKKKEAEEKAKKEKEKEEKKEDEEEETKEEKKAKEKARKEGIIAAEKDKKKLKKETAKDGKGVEARKAQIERHDGGNR